MPLCARTTALFPTLLAHLLPFIGFPLPLPLSFSCSVKNSSVIFYPRIFLSVLFEISILISYMQYGRIFFFVMLRGLFAASHPSSWRSENLAGVIIYIIYARQRTKADSNFFVPHHVKLQYIFRRNIFLVVLYA